MYTGFPTIVFRTPENALSPAGRRPAHAYRKDGSGCAAGITRNLITTKYAALAAVTRTPATGRRPERRK